MTMFLWASLSSGSAIIANAVFAQAANPILVQQGQHPDYSRIVMALPAGSTARVEKNGTILRVILRGRHRLDFSGLLEQPLVHIGNPRQAIVGNATYAEFDMPADANFSENRPNNLLIVDVTPGPNSTPVVKRRPPRVTASRARGSRPARAQSDNGFGGGDEDAGFGDGSNGAGGNDASAADYDRLNDSLRAQGDNADIDGGGSGGADGGDPASDGSDINRAQADDDAAATQSDKGQNSATNSDSNPNLDDVDRPRPLAALPDGTGRRVSAQDDAINALDGRTSGEVANNLRLPLGPAGAQQDEDADSAVQDVTLANLNEQRALQISGRDYLDDQKPEVTLDVTSVENGLALRFNWDVDVAAAAFERGRFLWVVFDRAYNLDLDGLIAAEQLATRRILGIELEDHPDALIFRLAVRKDQYFSVEKDGQTWVLYLKDTPAQPRFPLRPTRRNVAGSNQQVFVPATDLGRKIEIEDQIVGDILTVFPLDNEGRGLAEGYSYSVAELPATSQGIVVISLTDDVLVERFFDGVGVSNNGNLFAEDAADETLAYGAIESKRLIDFKSWRDDERDGFLEKQKELLYRLSVAPEQELNVRRWDLARFYLGYNRPAETQAYLQLMQREQPELEREGPFLAVRAVSSYRLRRYKEAMDDLSHDTLENEQDADLWRTAVATELGDYRDALDYYRRGIDVIGAYDVEDRARIQLAAIRSAIATEDFERAEREIYLTEDLDLEGRLADELKFEKTRYYLASGRHSEALDLLDELTLSPDHPIAARASYLRLRQALDDGTIDPGTAINQLERLRYMWRGGDLEIQIIDLLGYLYQQEGRYRDSLNALKTGLSFLPEQAANYEFSSRQRGLFRELFLDNRADELRPLQAITLWYEFRELTPLGSDGDRMIRNLANRLVDIEAFDEAAELLTYQVTERLEGAARAQVAYRLAAILITAGKPNDAMRILRATREPRLPEDIEDNRRWVEARALVEMDRFEEAEVLLENDQTPNAERLRGDLYWSSKEWDKLINVNRTLLGDGWRRGESLTPTQRVTLIRLALAMTFEDDKSGLSELRQRYGRQMQAGSFAIAFQGLTSDQQLTTKELGDIASSIANVEKYRDFLNDYAGDFGGSSR